MRVYCSEEDIVQNLKDAGCDKAMIEIVMNDFRAGKYRNGTQLLQKHRFSLLNDLHISQKKIDCLDYLLFILRKQDKNRIKN